MNLPNDSDKEFPGKRSVSISASEMNSVVEELSGSACQLIFALSISPFSRIPVIVAVIFKSAVLPSLRRTPRIGFGVSRKIFSSGLKAVVLVFVIVESPTISKVRIKVLISPLRMETVPVKSGS